jgi:hypothetical protein
LMTSFVWKSEIFMPIHHESLEFVLIYVPRGKKTTKK